jgi:hypothetical protein
MLRRIAGHDDVPDTIQADARNYLQDLEAAVFGSGLLKGEAHAIGDLQNAPQVMERLPRPRRATG